jgi:predicted NBD/HSP70 family sugar kinase
MPPNKTSNTGISKVRTMDWQVLQVIHRLGPTPQHKLAAHIGRQRSTVNGAVQRLLTTGWLARAGEARAGRGRPAILLGVNPAVGCFAGLDITAARLNCAVVAADGTLREHVSTQLRSDDSAAGVIDQIDLTLRGVLSRLDINVDRLLGVWAGVNGVVDHQGLVVSCASLRWHNVPLREALERQFHCDALVQGAATTLNASAEALLGAGRDASSLVYFHVGRGISARFVERGQPLAGATQRAGEIGHVVVQPGGPKCTCGNSGCLEAVASGRAIAAAVRHLSRRQMPESVSKALRPADADGEARIVHAAFQHGGGDEYPELATIVRDALRYLSMGAAMAVAAYDPAVLVLGGYVFEENQAARQGVQRMLKQMVLDWDKRKMHVYRAEIMAQDRAVGGAAEVCQRFWANPRGVLLST